MSDLVKDFESKKSEIVANEDLSQEGKRKAFEALAADTKQKAREAIRVLRSRAIRGALSLRDAQRLRLERAGVEIDQMDYARLNYQAQALRYKLESAPSVEAAMVAWESAKESKDKYELRAWRDLAPGIINARGGEDYTGYKKRLIEEIESADIEIIRDPELASAEIEAMVDLNTIGSEASEIGEEFALSSRAVSQRVMEGIEFDNGKVLVDFDYKYMQVPYSTEIRKESAGEVVERLERERKERVQKYNEEIMEVGFESLDPDFDDFEGAFVESE